jgi:ubiquinone/menaquinone biosynthesis C-methylase UbiE
LLNREVTQRNYDRLSHLYDLLAGGSERALSQLGLRALAAQPGESILEVGYGTGQALAKLAAEVGEKGTVLGIDLSAGMAAKACRRMKTSRSWGQILLTVADGVQMPFKAASVDAIWMAFTLELFCETDALLVVKECRRVLKSGGRLGVVYLAKTGKPGWMERLYGWAHRSFPVVIDCHPIELDRLLAAADFQLIVSNRHLLWGLPVDIMVARN